MYKIATPDRLKNLSGLIICFTAYQVKKFDL